ncbi:phage tail protein [Paenibacillus allorhizosphaerae]|uniref:Phage tail protein n=1 Tax=Paenibacillus allorhizosphaerae TaxID=2849866 RepID=A0ABN7TJV0_9BACL|nr:phage tail protein [Paenibacillus allorhizosphaerae]CAG7640719.1 hypothetical protein PAECIP111802_02677 [Paenibacillus allorhizosphaerae]
MPETNFFSFNKKADWQQGYLFNLEAENQELTLQRARKYSISKEISLPDIFMLAQADADDSGGESKVDIVDFTVGPAGRLLLLDNQTNIWLFDYYNGHQELLFRQGHDLFSAASLLAYTDELLLVADGAETGRITAFSADNGQIRWTLEQWDGNPLYPVAVDTDAKGNIYAVVLLRPSGMGVIVLDPEGQVTAVHGLAGSSADDETAGVHLRERFFISVRQEHEFVVLDAGLRTLYTGMGSVSVPLDLQSPDLWLSGVAVDAGGEVYIGNRQPLRSDEEGNRSLLKYNLQGELLEQVSGFRGQVHKMLMDDHAKIFVLNFDRDVLTMLEYKQRIRETEPGAGLVGHYWSTSIDSTVEDTIWHKVTLVADIPEETQLKLYYYSSDREDIVVDGVWTNLDAFVLDPSVSMEAKLKATRNMWSEAVINPVDALFFEAQGRYLWIRIEYNGTEQKSPAIRRMRVYFPRTSYLQYLPAVYQEDPDGTRFLERFLSLFAVFFDGMEEEIAGISKYFDVETSPEEFLKWLASWLGIAVNDLWTERQIRELIRQAPTLYRQRGTRKAIGDLLHIYTGSRPFIVEHFEIRKLLEKSEWKSMLTELYTDNPYCFCILLEQKHMATEKQRQMIQTIVNEQKPAHTEMKLVVLQPWMFMDMHTYLGINSILTEPSEITLDTYMTMPHNTLLGEGKKQPNLRFQHDEDTGLE